MDSAATVRVADTVTPAAVLMYGPVYASTVDLSIGAYNKSSDYFNGKLHYFALIDGVILSEVDHDAMYAKFKKDGILPLTMSSTAAKKKIYVGFDARALGGSTNVGVTRLSRYPAMRVWDSMTAAETDRTDLGLLWVARAIYMQQRCRRAGSGNRTITDGAGTLRLFRNRFTGYTTRLIWATHI
jgi:hypothetical protein